MQKSFRSSDANGPSRRQLFLLAAGAASATVARAPATVAENAPAANGSSSRRDGPFESELLNVFCIVSALLRSPHRASNVSPSGSMFYSIALAVSANPVRTVEGVDSQTKAAVQRRC